MNNREIGKNSEDYAADYLKNKGYRILERNFRNRLGEVDIIAAKNGLIVFVEVKSRKSLKYGLPCEAVNYSKIQRIKVIALSYIKFKGIYNSYFRFDVIEIFLNNINKVIALNHIENAFT